MVCESGNNDFFFSILNRSVKTKIINGRTKTNGFNPIYGRLDSDREQQASSHNNNSDGVVRTLTNFIYIN